MSAGRRCPWAGDDPLYVAYHDTEWGVPQFDDRALYEKITLEGFQAGLSWLTILRKRAHFREVFDGFDPEKVARYTPKKIDALLRDPGIIRHRGKIEAAIAGAQAVERIMERPGGFSAFIWSFVAGTPVQNTHARMDAVPAQTPMSTAMAKALKAEGFKFCGPTTAYAFAQSMGLVNDHLTDCPRHAAVAKLAKRRAR